MASRVDRNPMLHRMLVEVRISGACGEMFGFGSDIGMPTRSPPK